MPLFNQDRVVWGAGGGVTFKVWAWLAAECWESQPWCRPARPTCLVWPGRLCRTSFQTSSHSTVGYTLEAEGVGEGGTGTPGRLEWRRKEECLVEI